MTAISPSVTRCRNADPDEAEFLALVARESGVPSGLCHDNATVFSATRLLTVDGVVSGFYWLAHGLACGHTAEIDYLTVTFGRRGHGLGRVLAQDACRIAVLLGLSDIRIVAHPPTEQFFCSVGGRRVGTEPASAAIRWTRPVLSIDLCATSLTEPRPVGR